MQVRLLDRKDRFALQGLRLATAQEGALGDAQTRALSVMMSTVKSQLQKPCIVFGAFVDDTLAGTACLLREPALPDCAVRYTLSDVLVSPALRGHHMGRELVQTCISFALSEGAHSLSLEVNTPNAPAVGLYRSLGFHAQPGIVRTYLEGDTIYQTVAMELPLAPLTPAPSAAPWVHTPQPTDAPRVHW